MANKEVIVKDYPLENLTKKYTFDKVFGPESKQVDFSSLNFRRLE